MSGYPRRSSSSPSQSHTPRYSGAHSNSSAFSKNAQPNEDWTQVSDLAERRRIQNRIAQRNYRQKLKKRLEELEHRADSQSASPEPSPSRDDGPGSNFGDRRRTSEQPSSSRGQFDVQHLNLFGQPFDDDSRMLGYQFCAQPSPPPPPSPPLPDHAGYASEHSRFSPQTQQYSTWQQQHPQHRSQQYYGAHHQANGSYYSAHVSPNLSATSTPPRSEAQFWTRQQDDGWGSWAYAPHNEHQQQSPMHQWQQGSSSWQAHYQDAASMKPGDDNVLGWGHYEGGYPTPPSSADLINPTINPFEEFLNIEST